MPNYSTLPYSTLLQRGRWRCPEDVVLSPKVHQWLSLSTSLTEQLRIAYGAIDVEVLAEYWIKDLNESEGAFFSSQEEQFWCREVILAHQKNPLIFARTLMPLSLINHYAELQNLGNRALGEWLFKHPNRIKQKQEWLQDEVSGFYARRTLIGLEKDNHQDHILVAELFLEPNIFIRGIQ